jgi:hypothetical protein
MGIAPRRSQPAADAVVVAVAVAAAAVAFLLLLLLLLLLLVDLLLLLCRFCVPLLLACAPECAAVPGGALAFAGEAEGDEQEDDVPSSGPVSNSARGLR